MNRIPQHHIENAARAYPTGEDAARALGIHRVTFSRLCAKYGIETPAARKQRLKKESAR